MTYTVGDGNVWTMAIYIVSQSQFFIIETDPLALPHTAGEALATSASFTAASFSGYYAMHISGAQAGVSSLILGQLICDGVSALTGTLNTAQSGTANSNSIAGTSYTIDSSSGRTTLSGGNSQLSVVYLSNPIDGISGFVEGTDSNGSFGEIEQQASSTPAFALSGLAGLYSFGTGDSSSSTNNYQVGTAEIDGASGAVAVTEDESSPNGLLADQANSATLTLTDPTGNGNVGSATVIEVTGTRIWVLNESSTNPGFIVLER
jgi:hypothetical protein